MRRHLGPVAWGFGLVATGAGTAAMGQTSAVLVPGFVPQALSGDGKVVAGTNPADPLFSLWTAQGGIQATDFYGGAWGLSRDGSAAVGFSNTPDGQRGWRWTAAGGRVFLTATPGPGGFIIDVPRAISADGGTVVGRGVYEAEPFTPLPFVWSQSGGLVVHAAGGYGTAFCVNADGSVSGGESLTTQTDGSQTLEATLWASATPPLFPAPGMPNSAVTEISDDGATAAGKMRASADTTAFRWNAASGVQPIPDMKEVTGMSSDGRVIVGTNYGDFPARIWDATHGTRLVANLLAAAGVETSGLLVQPPVDVSDDGRIIVGTLLGGGATRMYVLDLGGGAAPSGACCSGTACAVVAGAAACTGGSYQGDSSACGPALNPTTCCPANYNLVNGVDLLDIFAFLNHWFGGNAQADFNHMNGVDLLDIFAFLNAWFGGC